MNACPLSLTITLYMPRGFRLRCRSAAARAEGGFVLALALVFLLLLTIIGVTALTTTSLEEKMAHNVKDKNLSFQAAETTLAYAEKWLLGLSSDPLIDAAVTTDGLHPQDLSGGPAVWTTIDWQSDPDLKVYPDVPTGSPTSGALSYVYSQPRYLIEHLGSSCGKSLKCGTSEGKEYSNYRVTARATGGTGVAVSMLQTTVKRLAN